MSDPMNAWQRLRFVILPALAPTTAFVVVIALIQLLQLGLKRLEVDGSICADYRLTCVRG